MSDPAPRLLLVAFASFPAPVGTATRIAQRLAALTQAGYSLDLLVPGTADLPHVSKLAGARILRVPMVSEDTGARRLAFERAAGRQLRGGDYDAVHVLDPWAGHAALALRRNGGPRVVFEAACRAPAAADAPDLGGEMRRRERELLRESDAVLVPTAEMARRARGLGASPHRIRLLRPSADPDVFRPAPRFRATPLRVALAAAELSEAELRLLAVALQFLPRALDVRVAVRAAVAPTDSAPLQADPVVAARVAFEPPVLQDDLPGFYARAHVGLVLSPGPVRGELPAVRLQAVAETMTSGLAPVLPDAPEVREIANDRQHALLVPPADPDALSSALQELAADAALRERIAAAARERALELLDENSSRTTLLSLYSALVGAPSVQVCASAWQRARTRDVPSGPTIPPGEPTDPDIAIHGSARPELSSLTVTAPGRGRRGV